MAAYGLPPQYTYMASCISLIHSIRKQIIYKNCLYVGNLDPHPNRNLFITPPHLDPASILIY